MDPKILLVEDLMDCMILMVRALQRGGFNNLVQATDYTTAISILESDTEIALVITDLDLRDPNGNGVLIAERVHTISEERVAHGGKRIPVIMQTSRITPDATRCMANGTIDVLIDKFDTKHVPNVKRLFETT
jgi:CheY-like chemotaxis protein